MKMTNIKTETYAYDRDDNYLIDIVTIDNGYEAYLYKFDYGYKMLMFGNRFDLSSYEEFVQMVSDSLVEYIEIYRREIEYDKNNAITGMNHNENPIKEATIEEVLGEMIYHLPNIYDGDVDDDFKFTHFTSNADYSEILSAKESDIEVLASFFNQLYGEYVINTGYYDPVEDEKNDEVDAYTGLYYVTIY